MTASVVVLAAVLAGCQPSRLRAPVYGGGGLGNFPDPSILYANGWYYAYSTTSYTSPPRNIQVMRSRDLYHWEDQGGDPAREAMPTRPSWARSVSSGGEFWAPTVARFGSRWVMYFGAKHANVSASSPGWCIGYAVSLSPFGPFTGGSQPLFCRVTSHDPLAAVTRSPASRQGAIDPQIYTSSSGAHFLHFKALDNPYQLWGIRLSSDGRSTSGSAHGLVSMPAQANVWEYSARDGFTVLENPAMSYNPNPGTRGFPYYLYYSGNDWRSNRYGTGVAACRHPLGPCIRATGNAPWLASRGSVSGPGGLSVFQAPSGQRWVAYHSWKANAGSGQGRRLHVEPLGYSGTTPVLLNRPPTGSFNALTTAIPGQVRFRGAADDPDTGQEALIRITEGQTLVSQRRVELDKSYDFYRNAIPPGSHRYCATVDDDNGGARRSLGCVTVVVAAAAEAGGASGPPPTTVPPSPPAAPAPTTIPPPPVPVVPGVTTSTVPAAAGP